MSATVDRTSQAMAHLGLANDARTARRMLKEHLRGLGRSDAAALVADLLSDAPPWLRSVYVWQLVQRIPWVGDEQTRVIMTAARVDPWVKVGRLTPTRTVALAAELRKVAAGVPVPSGPRRKPRTGPHYCCGCGLYMPRRTPERLCGFCTEELA